MGNTAFIIQYYSILNLSEPAAEFIKNCDYCLVLNYVFFQVCASIGQLLEKTAGASLSLKFSLGRPGNGKVEIRQNGIAA